MARPKKTKPADPFADQEEFLRVVEAAAKRAARRARAENNRMGLPTPVKGERGKVAYRLRGKVVAAPER